MSTPAAALTPRIRVAVLDMQPITPATGGGRLRLLGLYHALGPDFDTTYVGTYDWPGERVREIRLSQSLTEIDVPLSTAHFRCDAGWRNAVGDVTIIDATFPILGRLSQDFLARARAAVAQADIVVFSHPWVYPLLAEHVDRTRQVLVYDAHNVESLLRYDVLGDSTLGRELAKGVAVTEALLCRAANVVVGCSAEDVAFFSDAYGIDARRTAVIPNGVFVGRIPRRERTGSRDSMSPGAPLAGTAIFIGSNYAPNLRAADFIVDALAPTMPDVTFLICGGASDGPELRGRAPPNVRLLGTVSDEEKLRHLHVADVAVNPMFSGSGTNIKMFDYLAAGLPVISTRVGARGICESSSQGIVVCAPDRIAHELGTLLRDGERCTRMGDLNRRWAERDFAWESLSPAFGDLIRRARTTQSSGGAPASHERHDARVLGPVLSANSAAGYRAAHAAPSIAIVSTFGIHCGIAEYTSYLVEGLIASGAQVTVIANDLAGHESSGAATARSTESLAVERSWHYDIATSANGDVATASVIATLRHRNVRHLNIQYHHGFFAEAMLVRLIREVVANGLGVSVTLHNSSGATVTLVDALARLDVVVIVHRPAEAQRLRDAGMHAAHWIPQGVRAPPLDAGGASGRRDAVAIEGPVISTFGFLRPHKGMLELVGALPILREIFPGLRLLAQSALYPSVDSDRYRARVLTRIDDLGVRDCVSMQTGFVAIDEAIARLARTTAVVLPYAASDEGSSAAAATALAARRPLITTRSHIFDELRGIAYRAEDNSPHVLAAAIANVLSNAALARHLERRSAECADARDWRRVARQFLDLVTGDGKATQPQNDHARDFGSFAARVADDATSG